MTTLGLYEILAREPADIGSLVRRRRHAYNWKSDMSLTKEELASISDFPVYRVSKDSLKSKPGYDPTDPFVGYEDGTGICVAYGLTPLQERVVKGHEVIGHLLGRKGKKHDDAEIARIEFAYFMEKGDMEAAFATAAGAKNARWN